MHIAIVTAGGAGMFCGSCMHDNTWARSLKKLGTQVTLLPTYTPLTLDEHDESTRPVFLGGINVYLDFRANSGGAFRGHSPAGSIGPASSSSPRVSASATMRRNWAT